MESEKVRCEIQRKTERGGKKKKDGQKFNVTDVGNLLMLNFQQEDDDVQIFSLC